MPHFPVLTDKTYAAEFLISEATHNRSREQGLSPDATAVVINAGMVLGKVTATDDYVALDLAATDGSEVPAGISFGEHETNATPTTGQRAFAVVVRDAEVNGNFLEWPAAITPAQKTAAETQLAGSGVLVRY